MLSAFHRHSTFNVQSNFIHIFIRNQITFQPWIKRYSVKQIIRIMWYLWYIWIEMPIFVFFFALSQLFWVSSLLLLPPFLLQISENGIWSNVPCYHLIRIIAAGNNWLWTISTQFEANYLTTEIWSVARLLTT